MEYMFELNKNGPQLGLFQEPPAFEAPDLDIAFEPHFFGPAEGDALFRELRDTTPWRQETMRFRDKVQLVPRLIAWYQDEEGEIGHDVSYQGMKREGLVWTPTLLRVRREVEKYAGMEFDSVLLSLYRDASDSVAWHRDRELGDGTRPVIAAISLGATRRFLLRHVSRKEVPKITVFVSHGSLLLMRGATNDCWEHHVPKLRDPVGERISLTFRKYGR